MSKDPLLQPLRIKHLTLKNRIMSTSHACGLEEGGMPTEAYQAYHEEKAKGGLALTMFGGSSNVAPDSPNVFRQLNVGVDEIIPHLQRFSARIHRHGAALMCQITHLGRRGESYAQDWLPTIAPSPVRETLHRAVPKEMDAHDIARVVAAFGDAAWRCKEGGLDGVETLAGAHLIGQFLSPATNRRGDGFGGSLENRCRFGLMVFEEMRRRIGDDFLLGFRFVVDEGHEAGLCFEDCLAVAAIFQASGLVDFFNAIYGRMDTSIALAVDNMPGMASPIAPWLETAGAFKRAIELPVFHAARITDLATARRAIREGLLDMVGMTRAHIAEPYLVAKLAAGREAEIRPCVGATHCMGDNRPTCLHNAATGRETAIPQQIPQSPGPGKTVVVVGGGPAGLEAARVSAERGHRVVLFEVAAKLGGQVLLAARASWRRDLVGLVDWRASELERLGVAVHLNRFAEEADVLAETPDVVVIATGGLPHDGWIEGGEHCTGLWGLLAGAAAPEGDCLVYDGTGRHGALTAAEALVAAGRRVDFVALDDHLAMEMAYAEQVIWKRRAYELGLRPDFDRRLIKVERRGNKLAAILENELTGAREARLSDHVLIEAGTLPAASLYDALRAQANNQGVTDLNSLLRGRPQPQDGAAGYALFRIGDAVASRNIAAAVYDALRLCRHF